MHCESEANPARVGLPVRPAAHAAGGVSHMRMTGGFGFSFKKPEAAPHLAPGFFSEHIKSPHSPFYNRGLCGESIYYLRYFRESSRGDYIRALSKRPVSRHKRESPTGEQTQRAHTLVYRQRLSIPISRSAPGPSRLYRCVPSHKR